MSRPHGFSSCEECELLNPSVEEHRMQKQLLPRLDKLHGSEIVLYNNTKSGVFNIMDHIKVCLEKHDITFRDMYYSRIPTREMIEPILDADAVICGVGDCGSCSMWLVSAAAEFEKRGLPTVAILTEPYAKLGATVLYNLDFGSIPLVILKNVKGYVGMLSHEELIRCMFSVPDTICKALTDFKFAESIAASSWLKQGAIHEIIR